MTIGTMLFTKLNTDAFSRVEDKISNLQAQVAAGVNDPKPSADPVRAARLSVAKEQQAVLARFEANVERVEMRLDQTDAVLNEVSNIVQRLQELSIRAASDSANQGERDTMRIEIAQLRGNLVDLANSKDDTGGALFGGFKRIGEPFQEGPEGVSYTGDRGRHQLRVSESSNLSTGLDVASVFMTVGTDQGRRDIFSIIDDLDYSLAGDPSVRYDNATLPQSSLLELNVGRKAEAISFDLTGPGGSATISAELVRDAPTTLRDAINAASAETGVWAELTSDGRDIILRSSEEMQIKNLSAEGHGRSHVFGVHPLDENDQLVGTPFEIIPARLARSELVANFEASSSHMADQRAAAGSLAQVAQRHAQTIQDRQVIMEKSRAGLEDLDVAKAVTELQTLLLNRDVSQQTFVKIAQNSLFDYLR